MPSLEHDGVVELFRDNPALAPHATLAALENLDRDISGVYFQIIWNTLREPMRKALEELVVQQQTRGEVKFPPFIQTLMDKRYLDGEVKGYHDGEVKGYRDGEVKGYRDGEVKGYRDGEVDGEVKGEVKTLREKILRVAQRRGLVLTDEQTALISSCDDRVLLDRWFDNVFDATNGAEILR